MYMYSSYLPCLQLCATMLLLRTISIFTYIRCIWPEIEFDSYMIPTSDLNNGDLRLLEVDNRIIVPIQTQVRVLVTAADVLHILSLI